MWRQAPIEQASNKQRERIDPGRAVRDHRWGAALPRIRAARSLYRRTFPVMGAVDSERERRRRLTGGVAGARRRREMRADGGRRKRPPCAAEQQLQAANGTTTPPRGRSGAGAPREGETAAIGRRRCEAVLVCGSAPLVNTVRCCSAELLLQQSVAADPEVWAGREDAAAEGSHLASPSPLASGPRGFFLQFR
jgi:hypothetical protein